MFWSFPSLPPAKISHWRLERWTSGQGHKGRTTAFCVRQPNPISWRSEHLAWNLRWLLETLQLGESYERVFMRPNVHCSTILSSQNSLVSPGRSDTLRMKPQHINGYQAIISGPNSLATWLKKVGWLGSWWNISPMHGTLVFRTLKSADKCCLDCMI